VLADLWYKMKAAKEPVPAEVDADDYHDGEPPAHDTNIPQDEGDLDAKTSPDA